MNSKIVEKLCEIQELCFKQEDYSAGMTVERLLRENEEDQQRFWDSLTSDAVWGGAGSIADQCFSHLRQSLEPSTSNNRLMGQHSGLGTRKLGLIGVLPGHSSCWTVGGSATPTA